MNTTDTFSRDVLQSTVKMMDLEPTTLDFITALRQQRERSHLSLPDAPELNQWLHYWNDEESFSLNVSNLAHWIACAKLQST
jgi:hypothetical protein